MRPKDPNPLPSKTRNIPFKKFVPKKTFFVRKKVREYKKEVTKGYFNNSKLKKFLNQHKNFLSREEKQFLKGKRLKPFYMSDLASGTASVAQIVNSLSEDVYITIDVDVLDPSIMPAVGTPEPDGMSWRQILDIVESVTIHKHVVGFDLMEFCPAEGPSSCAFLLAKLAYKVIGWAIPQEGR